MIKEIRHDFPERKMHRRNGEVYKVIPAHHDCTYYIENESGRKFVLAEYWGTDDLDIIKDDGLEPRKEVKR